MRRQVILCMQLEHFYARVACLQMGEAAPARVAVTREGRVLDASPEAVAAGLRPGMRVREARRWFPDATFVPAVDEVYLEYARPILDLCASYTPLVDPETPARVFLDVAGCGALYGSPERVAGALARRIPQETGFACVVGCGRSRLVAALAAPMGRLVPPGGESEFLAPLPLSCLKGVLSREMVEWLELRGVATFGAVCALPPGMLWRRFGREGEKLIQLAQGFDPTPVRPAYPPPRVDARVECEHPPETEEAAGQYLAHLAFGIANQLKVTREQARLHRLCLSFREGETAQAAVRLPAPVSSPRELYQVLLRLFRKLSPQEPPLEMTATAEEITQGEAFQGSLFPEMEDASAAARRERDRRLGHVLSLLAARYGPAMVAPGCHLWTSRRPRFLDRVAREGW
ncbi:MAG TPA: hypothetical protein GX715_12695 [Armatimonadetes bacterium]|jgi:nucleotidyltransferase/DNA polymerase involved in DNA repair|nr:hypothetical protein [Armatimonadota bacterium]